MLFLLCLLTFVAFSSSYSCGDCICSDWQNTVTCIGEKVDEIVSLNDYTWVKHVDILDTNITELSALLNWTDIQTMDIRDNGHLDCAIVLEMKYARPDVVIITDCDDIDPTPIAIESANGEMHLLNLLLLIPSIIIITFVTYLKKQLPKTDEYQRAETMV